MYSISFKYQESQPKWKQPSLSLEKHFHTLCNPFVEAPCQAVQCLVVPNCRYLTHAIMIMLYLYCCSRHTGLRSGLTPYFMLMDHLQRDQMLGIKFVSVLCLANTLSTVQTQQFLSVVLLTNFFYSQLSNTLLYTRPHLWVESLFAPTMKLYKHCEHISFHALCQQETCCTIQDYIFRRLQGGCIFFLLPPVLNEFSALGIVYLLKE